MSTRGDSRRPTILVATADPATLDLWTAVFEGRGAAVITAATARQAIAHLDADRAIDVVVAAWDPRAAIGGEIYRWTLAHRVALRGQFVFVADEVVPEFDRIVGGRCLVVRADEIEELVRVVDAATRRAAQVGGVDEADVAWLGEGRPSLLLVDDDPLQLMVMAPLLGEVGFLVTSVESGNAAIAQLEASEFDVILSDWYMADGSGADLYRWICTAQPWVLDRLIVLTGGDTAAAEQGAQGVPVVPKGQDSSALVTLLTETARRRRGAA